MFKNKDELIKQKKEIVANIVSDYIDKLNTLSDTDDFTIDNIENMWKDLRESTNQVFTEINNEVIKQMDEKQIIKEKK